MKKISSIILLLLGMVASYSQQKPDLQWTVNQITKVDWNTSDGMAYMKGPGVNLGATSFQILNETQIALLSNVSDEIVIVNSQSGKSEKRLGVAFSPRDFVYDSGLFYVLSERDVFAYDTAGVEKGRFSFQARYEGIERLARFNNSTYLLLASGNCIKIESGGESIETEESEGWITNSGSFIATRLDGNAYIIKVVSQAGKVFQKVFTINHKAAGAFVVGCTSNRLLLDVQGFISENPVEVERTFVEIELSEAGLGNILTSKKAPSCYYVLSNKDIDISQNSTVFNMVTSPTGLYIFSLTESTTHSIQDYPAVLQKTRYHFNDHLIKVD